MSILKLTPACKDYLWGGTKLITDYGKRYDGASRGNVGAGAVILISPPCSRPAPTRAKRSRNISPRTPGALGEHGRKFAELPVLIKLIDAAKDLSIQVHPDDDYARAHEGQNGKRRCGTSSPPSRTPFSTAAFSRDISGTS